MDYVINKSRRFEHKSFSFDNYKFGGSRSLENNRIRSCKVCATNGFPHEAIIFQKVEGRVLSDGTNETKKWLVLDYFQPCRLHKHKHRKGNF